VHLVDITISTPPFPFLLVASDGIFGEISDLEAVCAVADMHFHSGLDAQSCAEKLVHEMAKLEDSDNVSCIVVLLEPGINV